MNETSPGIWIKLERVERPVRGHRECKIPTQILHVERNPRTRKAHLFTAAGLADSSPDRACRRLLISFVQPLPSSVLISTDARSRL